MGTSVTSSASRLSSTSKDPGQRRSASPGERRRSPATPATPTAREPMDRVVGQLVLLPYTAAVLATKLACCYCILLWRLHRPHSVARHQSTQHRSKQSN